MSTDNDIQIREGRPGDEAAIASVHIHAWQQSYKGQMPDSVLDALPLTYTRRLAWWKSVVGGETPTHVFVADSAKHGIVAFCAVEPARDAEYAGFGEIAAIYSLNEYKGKGVGSKLFRMGIELLKAQGFPKQYLWVLKDNPTKAFYTRMGGREQTATKKLSLAGQELTEVAFIFG